MPLRRGRPDIAARVHGAGRRTTSQTPPQTTPQRNGSEPCNSRLRSARL